MYQKKENKMERIQEVTKQEQVELFKWLFGEDVKIKEEPDVSLAPYYEDINIYYTEEIEQLFQTKAMKRLGKIMQLGSSMYRKSNVYHTRLEHSKGAYRNCVQFLVMQYRKPEWKKYIEDNRLKGYLVEKMKFMCVHDVGHFMLSHATEELVGDQNCNHEDIGQKILQEDEEIKNAFEKIKAKEEDSNIEGDGSLELFCEGNIDFDRMDFSLRDRLHVGEKAVEDTILNLDAMCDLKWVEEEKAYRYVYRPEALPYIEKFLTARDYMYQTEYTSKRRKIDDELSVKLVDRIKNGEIQRYLSHIVGKSLEEISVQDYLKINDIIFLNELIKSKKDLEQDEILRYVVPDNQTVLKIAISLLDPKNTDVSTYSEEEKDFLRNLRSVLSQEEKFPKENMEDIIPSVQLEEDKREEILKKIQEALGQKGAIQGIYPYKRIYRKYKKEEPIYIQEEDGEIVTLDQYSKLQIDLSTKYGYGIFGILPELKEQGYEAEKIEQIKDIIKEYKKEENILTNGKLESNRMNLFRTEHGGINYEEKFNQFFDDEEER